MPSSASPFLTARWVDLAIVNYEVDPALLRALVPAGTELDLWSGGCLASVVGFQFLDTRVLGLALPFHRNFEEVNLRFYVRRTVEGEVRRGVVFVKEIVPRRAIAWIASAVYNEKYIPLPMSHDDATIGDRRRLSYGWRYQGAWCRLAVTFEGDRSLPADDSEEAFITEHYWGYTTQRDGSTLEYKVEHPRWHVWTGSASELICDTAALYGAGFGSVLSGPPSSCFLADGSAVIVRRGVPLR